MMVHAGAKLANFLVLLVCVAWSVAVPVRIVYEDSSENAVLSSEDTRPINWESNSWKLMPNRWSSAGRTTVSPTGSIERSDELQVLEEDAEFLESVPTNNESPVTTVAPNVIAPEDHDYDDNNELTRPYEVTAAPEMNDYDGMEDTTTMTSLTDQNEVFLQSHEDDSLVEEPTEIPVTRSTITETTRDTLLTVPTTVMTRTVTRRPTAVQTTAAPQTSDAAQMAELARKVDEIIALAHKMFFQGTTMTRRNPRRQRPWFSRDSSDYEDTIIDGNIPPRRHPSPSSSWFNSGPFNSNWNGFTQASEPSGFVLVVPEPEDYDVPAILHEQEGYGGDVERSILTAIGVGDSDESGEDSWVQSRRDFWADISDW